MNINQVWSEWHEDCVLGEGSFGKVYRAKRVEYGRTFYSAIKVITVPKNQQEIKFARSQGMNDQEIYNYFHGLVENLLNEITLMDNLKGAKNIVGIEDYKIIERQGEIGWDIFIRMELLNPFNSFITNPDFSQKDVIRLGVDICSALEVCEQNYIVHRDIKPDNIFISKFGEYKLGDFGIARKLETTQANLSRKGTLNYMAPEVYKSEQYGSNVDIYSLGLVLYTLLNNNRVAFLPPYPQPIAYSDNEEALAKRLAGEPLTPPCNANASLGAVILKACAYNPWERYQTATEFKNALINEWNLLAQYGNNGEINSDAGRFVNTVVMDPHRTIDDMTANGRVLVDQRADNSSAGNQYDNSAYYASNDFGAEVDLSVIPDNYSTAKSNKACRILSWPLAAVVCVLAFVSMLSGGIRFTSIFTGIAMLSVAFTTIFADRNKIAMAVSTAALSLSYIFEGIGTLIGGGQLNINATAIVTLLSGLLIFVGAVVMAIQREVRLGGAFCMYAIAAEWLFKLYGLINQGFSVELWHVFFSITAFLVFIWAYGYKSDDKPTGFRKILHIAAYVFLPIPVITALIFVAVNAIAIFL